MTEELEHSPLGASSAERWMNCPGSSVLLNKLTLPQSDETDFQAVGTAAHEAAAECLRKGLDAWETVGQKFHSVTVDDQMAIAIQVYLDNVRSCITEGATVYIEERIGKAHDGTRPHPKFYGTADFVAYDADRLLVVDLKFGEGIVVEPIWNVQLLYYAYGVIIARQNVRDDREVILRIVQPRAFHVDGPVRDWVTSAGEIKHWAETELLPAMQAAEVDGTLSAGKWCRFCPAKLFCPLLTGLFGAAAKADPKAVTNFSNVALGLEYDQRDAVKYYLKALEDEVFRRNNLGVEVPGTKLVYKKTNRVFKEGAVDIFKTKFGDQAFSAPSIKSPAEMEKIDPSAKLLVREWAYMPVSGLTVAPTNDPRPAVKVETLEDTFAHLIPK